jgi:hypothetical protein
MILDPILANLAAQVYGKNVQKVRVLCELRAKNEKATVAGSIQLLYLKSGPVPLALCGSFVAVPLVNP